MTYSTICFSGTRETPLSYQTFSKIVRNVSFTLSKRCRVGRFHSTLSLSFRRVETNTQTETVVEKISQGQRRRRERIEDLCPSCLRQFYRK